MDRRLWIALSALKVFLWRQTQGVGRGLGMNDAFGLPKWASAR